MNLPNYLQLATALEKVGVAFPEKPHEAVLVVLKDNRGYGFLLAIHHNGRERTVASLPVRTINAECGVYDYTPHKSESEGINVCGLGVYALSQDGFTSLITSALNRCTAQLPDFKIKVAVLNGEEVLAITGKEVKEAKQPQIDDSNPKIVETKPETTKSGGNKKKKEK